MPGITLCIQYVKHFFEDFVIQLKSKFKQYKMSNNKLFHTSNDAIQFALLIIRVGFGIIYILHGFPKIIGGPERWVAVGGAMGFVGLGFAPAFWGLMAALSEFVGGLLLVLGLYARIAVAFLAFTMLIATIMHISTGDPLGTVLHPVKGLVVFIALLYSGAGIYALDTRLGNR